MFYFIVLVGLGWQGGWGKISPVQGDDSFPEEVRVLMDDTSFVFQRREASKFQNFYVCFQRWKCTLVRSSYTSPYFLESKIRGDKTATTDCWLISDAKVFLDGADFVSQNCPSCVFRKLS